jgi:Kyanoviridae NAD synthetase
LDKYNPDYSHFDIINVHRSLNPYENPWTYEGKPVDSPGDWLGFVYLITNTVTGRLYVGKKLFVFSRLRTFKKKRKRVRVESDWKAYYSSSNTLRADVDALGRDKFKREILHFCSGRAQMNYLELREQVDRRVLETGQYYNEEIRVRVHRHPSLALK